LLLSIRVCKRLLLVHERLLLVHERLLLEWVGLLVVSELWLLHLLVKWIHWRLLIILHELGLLRVHWLLHVTIEVRLLGWLRLQLSLVHIGGRLLLCDWEICGVHRNLRPLANGVLVLLKTFLLVTIVLAFIVMLFAFFRLGNLTFLGV